MMKWIIPPSVIAALACAVWIAVIACNHQQTTAGEKAATSSPSCTDLVGDVTRRLFGNDYAKQLEDLAKTKNALQSAISCAVDIALAVLTARPLDATGPATREASPVVLHARAYLAAHPK